MTRIDACTRPVSVCQIERGIVAEEMGRPLDRLYFENETVVARLLSGLEMERGVAGRVPNRGLTTRDWQRFCSANSRQQILDSRHHTTSASARFLLVHTACVPSPRFPALDPRPSTDPRLPLGTRLEQRWCVIDFAPPLQRPINEYCAAGSNPLYTRYACTVLELEHLY